MILEDLYIHSQALLLLLLKHLVHQRIVDVLLKLGILTLTLEGYRCGGVSILIARQLDYEGTVRIALTVL